MINFYALIRNKSYPTSLLRQIETQVGDLNTVTEIKILTSFHDCKIVLNFCFRKNFFACNTYEMPVELCLLYNM